MIEFFRKIFAQPGSSTTAKERLRLVLMSDHIQLSPEMMEQLKRDLVDVLSRYVEVDRSKVEVNFEEHDKSLAMLANIPVISVNRPSGGSGGSGGTHDEHDDEESVEAAPAGAALATDAGTETRRKRRKKASGQNGSAAPAPAT